MDQNTPYLASEEWVKAVVAAARDLLPDKELLDLWRKMLAHPNDYLIDPRVVDEWVKLIRLADLLGGSGIL